MAFIALCCSSITGFAEADQVVNGVSSAPSFNSNQALAQLDEYANKLSLNQYSLIELNDLLPILADINTQAENCYKEFNSETEKIANKMEALIPPETSIENNNDYQQLPEYVFLKSKKDLLAQRGAECKIIVIRIEEVDSQIKSRVAEKKTAQFLHAKMNLFAAFENLDKDFTLTNFASIFKSITKQHYQNLTEYKQFYWFYALSLAFSLLLIIGMRRYTQRDLEPSMFKNLVPSIKLSLLLSIREKIFYLAIFAAIYLTSSIFVALTNTHQIINNICLLGTLFIVYLICIRLVFLPPDPKIDWLFSARNKRHIIYSCLKLNGYVVLVYCLVLSTLANVELPQSYITISRLVAFTILVPTNIFLITQIKYISNALKSSPVISAIFTGILVLLLLTSYCLEIAGFSSLALFLMKGFISGLSITIFFWIVQYIIFNVIHSMFFGAESWQEQFRRKFGLSKGQKPHEFIILNLILYVVLWGGYVFSLLYAWDVPFPILDFLTALGHEGFKIAGLTLYPFRIIIALSIYVLFSFLTRLISSHVGQQLKKQDQSSESLATIYSYIGFAITLMFTLAVAGIDFTSLAIIAGALSVGIGFGLQNIISNFVSGIILLIERPIKPGDRIIVGNTEGYVKKVSVRSTYIQTIKASDVIVPNSELITSQVVNLMYKDSRCRICVKVGVAYQSDLKLAKETLLTLASNHPDICNTEQEHPNVYFVAFDDSSIGLELWACVNDVSVFYRVKSDLIYEIKYAFEKKGITIPFPQRDINIRTIPLQPDAPA